MKSKKVNDINLIFSYLCFLFEVQKSKLLFYVETIKQKKSMNLSILDMCFANEI